MFTASLIRRIAIIGVVCTLALLAYALSGKPVGITFASGSFNLTIDSFATYNGVPVPGSTWDVKNLVPGSDKFFNLSNVLPGDSGQTTVSMHVNEDAWVCLAFSNLAGQDNGENEPEDPEDPSTPSNKGELAEGTEFFAWHDDGDNTFEVGELPIFGTSAQAASQVMNAVTYALADSQNSSPIPAGSTRYVGIHWCAGNLGVNLATAAMSCDGAALGNIAQTDSFSIDLGIQAAAAGEQPNFRCSLGGEPPPPPPRGLGEQIGLFVKCEKIAQMGWPLPKYKTECPNGFGANNAQAQSNSTATTRRERTTTTPSVITPSSSRTNTRSR